MALASRARGASAHPYFMSFLTADGKYLARTGDVAYAEAIISGAPEKMTLLGKAEDERTEEAIYQKMMARSNGKPGVLHVLLNFDTTTHHEVDKEGVSRGHTVEGLRAFKEQTGTRIVLTSIEFHLYASKHKGKDYEARTLPYFEVADEVIFLDQKDKQSAIQSYHHAHPQNQETLKKLKSAAVVMVPCTVKLADIPLEERRGDHLAFMGMMRPAKGIEHVLALAELLKAQQAPQQIVFICSTNRQSDHAAQLCETELAKVLLKLYPAQADAVKACADYTAMVALGQQLAKHETPALPVRLYMNYPVQDYPELLAGCKSMIALDQHGASLRNTVKSSAVCSGFRLYTTASEITPDVLMPGGKYDGAMILLDKDKDFATQILEDMQQRAKDPELDHHTAQTQAALSHLLMPKGVAAQHLKLYRQSQIKPSVV